MSPKTVIGLAIATLICFSIATLVVTLNPGSAPVRVLDEPAFPTLRETPDAVAKVTIESDEGNVVLTRSSAETWVAPNQDDYPASLAKIRSMVVQLADMRLIEAKTSNPERYGRIDLDDIDREGSASRLVRLEDASGQVLAETLLGKRRFKLTGTEPAGIYIRRAGEAQSWLASGGIELDTGIEAWLEQDILSIGPERIQRVVIALPDDQSYTAERPSPEAPLILAGLKEGESLDPSAGLTQLAGTLSVVRLVDVAREGEIIWPAKGPIATVTTFDGLELTLNMALIDDKPWARIEAKADSLPRDIAADTLRQEVEAITNTTAGWAYQVNQSLFQRLTKPRSSWLADTDGTS